MEIYIKLPKPKTQEGSSFVATAYFRDSEASTVPTTAQYRVDCLTTGKEITDWTTLTPAASISITITPTHNAIQSQSNTRERKQLTVESNTDLTTQVRQTTYWDVENIRGI